MKIHVSHTPVARLQNLIFYKLKNSTLKEKNACALSVHATSPRLKSVIGRRREFYGYTLISHRKGKRSQTDWAVSKFAVLSHFALGTVGTQKLLSHVLGTYSVVPPSRAVLFD